MGNLWIQLVPKVPAPSVESESFGYVTDRAGFRPSEDSLSRRLRTEPYGAWPTAE